MQPGSASAKVVAIVATACSAYFIYVAITFAHAMFGNEYPLKANYQWCV